ncbi:MAG: MBL fold metallo-hydrolase [Gemmatimonadota bacterium]
MKRSNRRRGMVGPLYLMIVMIAGCALPDQSEDEIFEVVGVADGIWATVVREGVSPSMYAASLIVIRTDHVLVVDSRHDDASANDLIETIADLTDLPVKYLVNTHWHGDHVQGNARFREAFPDVQIVGASTTGRDMLTLGRQRLDEQIERAEGRIATATGWLESGTKDDGTPLTEEERASLLEQIEATRSYAEARRAIKLVPPTMSIDAQINLDDAQPTVTVTRVGPAHTSGDLVVTVPDAGVMALGDLIEDGFPYLGDGSPAGWARALRRVSGIEAEILLGAHGPVLWNREMLETQTRFAESIVDAARTAASSGVPLEEARAGFDASEFQAHFTRRVEGTAADREARYREFVDGIFDQAYAEATTVVEEAVTDAEEGS